MSPALSSLISSKVVPSPLSRAMKMPLIPELFTALTLIDPYLATVALVRVMDNFVGATLCGIGEHAENINNAKSVLHQDDFNGRIHCLFLKIFLYV